MEGDGEQENERKMERENERKMEREREREGWEGDEDAFFKGSSINSREAASL